MVEAGADGVAVIGALAKARDTRAEAAAIKAAMADISGGGGAGQMKRR